METKVLNYRVIIEPEIRKNGEKVYCAYSPTLGVSDYGDSVEEVLESMRDGMELAIEFLIKEGKDVPSDNLSEQIVASMQVSLPKSVKGSFA